MPVYAYTCRDCGTPLEVHQEFSDAALTECPVCGGRLRKQYGTIGVTFNGSGFYRTDSRSGGAAEGSRSESAGSESKGSESKGSDSKGSGAKGSDSKGAPASAPAAASAAKPTAPAASS